MKKSKLPVYVVDDDKAVTNSLKSVLEYAGYQVYCFAGAVDFLQSKPEPSGVLILDLKLPDIHGLEVQQRLVKKGVYLPIIIYSGTADIPDTVSALKEGAYTVLQKPVAAKQLIDVIDEAAKHAEKVRQDLVAKQTAAEQVDKLSPRELSIALLTAEGLSATQIAEKLFISKRTAETHKSNIFKKLDIGSTAPLIRMLMLSGHLS